MTTRRFPYTSEVVDMVPCSSCGKFFCPADLGTEKKCTDCIASAPKQIEDAPAVE